MVQKQSLDCIERCSIFLSHAAGLLSRGMGVHSAIALRKAWGAITSGPPCRWSDTEAHVIKASPDRALWRKDAHVEGYQVSNPGQTGMRSPSALSLPELAAGLGVHR
jgi:hypothetical protein